MTKIFDKFVSEFYDMDTPFQYSRPATGKNFVGRQPECNLLEALLRNRTSAVLCAPAKTGKRSLIHQVLCNLRIGLFSFTASETDMTSVRDSASFLARFASDALTAGIPDPAQREQAARSLLDGIPVSFRFDSQCEDTCQVVPEGIPDRQQAAAMLRLPETIAERTGTGAVVVLREFQNIAMTEDDTLPDLAEEVWTGCRKTSFIFSGSATNAMKDIFFRQKYFWCFAENVEIGPVDEKEMCDYINKGFQKSGKVAERELLAGAVRLLDGNCWYINQLFSFCDSLSRGYINEGVLGEALEMLVAAHEPRFMETASGMTGHQTSLFRAILDGVTRFSSGEIIGKYRLNSSANVRRVKDALQKKEIITFDADDNPHILDPLFRYWMTKYFFR